MRLSEEDARIIAMAASDAAMEALRCGDELWYRSQDEWERIADDFAEGFRRVIKCVEFP